MSKMKFKCLKCNSPLEADESAAYRVVSCPQCHRPISIPPPTNYNPVVCITVPPSTLPPPDLPPGTPALKACPFCGEMILAVAKKCKHCGEFLENNRALKTTNNHDDVVRSESTAAALGGVWSAILRQLNMILAYLVRQGTTVWKIRLRLFKTNPVGNAPITTQGGGANSTREQPNPSHTEPLETPTDVEQTTKSPFEAMNKYSQSNKVLHWKIIGSMVMVITAIFMIIHYSGKVLPIKIITTMQGHSYNNQDPNNAIVTIYNESGKQLVLYIEYEKYKYRSQKCPNIDNGKGMTSAEIDKWNNAHPGAWIYETMNETVILQSNGQGYLEQVKQGSVITIKHSNYRSMKYHIE